VISAYLIGDAEVLSRLRAIPEDVNSGVARAVTKLAIDLRRRVEEGEVIERSGAGRHRPAGATFDLMVDQNSDGVSATLFTNTDTSAERFSTPGKGSLRRRLKQVKRSFGEQLIGRRGSARPPIGQMTLPNTSFLGTVLAEMSPSIAAEVAAAVNEAVTP
jgi:hypothetical protein